VWIDIISPTAAEIRSLMHEFGIDQAMAQELLLPSYRQKIEKRGEMTAAVLHFPALRGMGSRPQQEIDFIIGRNFLITTRYETIGPMHAFAKTFEVNTVLGRNQQGLHAGHLFVDMVGNLYQALVEESELLHQQLNNIEDRIFSGDEKRMVAELSQTGRTIHDFRQSLIPHHEMLRSLGPALNRQFGQEFSFYLNELEGVYMRVERTLANLREEVTELRETNNSLLSTKQNEVMKNFTVLAFFFFPLNFIGEVFLMFYYTHSASNMTELFWGVIVMMALLATGLFLYFKRKGWL
jgi:magnesium transporter